MREIMHFAYKEYNVPSKPDGISLPKKTAFQPN